MARNATPVAYPGSPLHLTVEFCANPPAHAARWLHGDRVFTPGNQYGSTVLAYGVTVSYNVISVIEYLLYRSKLINFYANNFTFHTAGSSHALL